MTDQQTTGFSKGLESFFDLQRTYMEQNTRIAERAVELQRDSLSAFANGADTGSRMQAHTTEAVSLGVGYYFDALQHSLNELSGSLGDARSAVDQAFDDAEEVQTQAWRAFEQEVEQGVTNYDEFTRSFIETMNQSFETALDNQREFERQAVEATMTLERTAEETVESVSEAVQDAAEEGVRAVEEAAGEQ